jgi:hypothetical protein
LRDQLRPQIQFNLSWINPNSIHGWPVSKPVSHRANNALTRDCRQLGLNRGTKNCWYKSTISLHTQKFYNCTLPQ